MALAHVLMRMATRVTWPVSNERCLYLASINMAAARIAAAMS